MRQALAKAIIDFAADPSMYNQLCLWYEIRQEMTDAATPEEYDQLQYLEKKLNIIQPKPNKSVYDF